MAKTNSVWKFVVAALAMTLLAASCGGSDADSEAANETDQTEASQPTAEQEPTPEPTPEPEPEPTPEPEPEPTAEPEPELEPTAEPEPTPEQVDGFAAVTATVQAFVDERELNGAGLIIVHRDDGVLYHEHFGEFTPDRVSLIASSSKMISAGVLLKLQEDGLLDINAPVSDVVEWGAANPAITPTQLISNSSGLVGLGPDLLYVPYLCQWGPNEELETCGEVVFAGEGDDEDVVPPDTEFRYGGAQWQVAGAVAEAASGKPWSQLIDEIYVEPCGVDSLGYISLGSVLTAGGLGYPTSFGGDGSAFPTENPNIEGGAYVTTGDYGELLLMHLRGGSCGDTQVLSQESLDTMHQDRIAAAYDGDAWSPSTGYGMGWWIDRETGRISDGGAFGTVPWLDLDDGYGAYLVVEDTSDTGQALAAEIEELVHAAVTGA